MWLLVCLPLLLVACSQDREVDPAPIPLSNCILGHWVLDPSAAEILLLGSRVEYSMRIDESTITHNFFVPFVEESSSGPVNPVQTGILEEVTMEYKLDGSNLIFGEQISSTGSLDPGMTDKSDISEVIRSLVPIHGSNVEVSCEGTLLRITYGGDPSTDLLFTGGDDLPTVVPLGRN